MRPEKDLRSNKSKLVPFYEGEGRVDTSAQGHQSAIVLFRGGWYQAKAIDNTKLERGHKVEILGRYDGSNVLAVRLVNSPKSKTPNLVPFYEGEGQIDFIANDPQKATVFFRGTWYRVCAIGPCTLKKDQTVKIVARFDRSNVLAVEPV